MSLLLLKVDYWELSHFNNSTYGCELQLIAIILNN